MVPGWGLGGSLCASWGLSLQNMLLGPGDPGRDSQSHHDPWSLQPNPEIPPRGGGRIRCSWCGPVPGGWSCFGVPSCLWSGCPSQVRKKLGPFSGDSSAVTWVGRLLGVEEGLYGLRPGVAGPLRLEGSESPGWHHGVCPARRDA